MSTIETNIQLADIATELNRLWDQEQGAKKIRASLFNLILYVEKKSEKTLFYQHLVRTVVSKFPGRIILVQVDKNATDEHLRTSVHSETIGEGELKIYCEIILIDVAGSLQERVPFIILPHLIPDLPYYLLWTEDPSIFNPIFSKLAAPSIDRFIFDAEKASNIESYCQTVLACIQHYKSRVSDLSWSALWGWRRIFEQIFDTDHCLLSLRQSSSIHIHYNKPLTQDTIGFTHAEIKAIYLHAWLASCLNWQFQTIEFLDETMKLKYKSSTGEVHFFLVPENEPDLTVGNIISLSIESQKEKGLFSIKRHPKTSQVFVQYSNKDRCDLPYITYLRGMREGEEILGEIFYPSAGIPYKEMLETLIQIPWKT